MRIGIDISQLAYPKTGVATYLQNLVQNLLEQDTENEYVLFYSSMRREFKSSLTKYIDNKQVVLKQFKIPPTALAFLWNTLHVLPVELLIGPVDVFISSDWTQPPTSAHTATILYDLIVYKYPKETAEKIVAVQKKRLQWVQEEVDKILCISEATKKDAEELLHIPSQKLAVVYPGL